jgi:hypothetical protein
MAAFGKGLDFYSYRQNISSASDNYGNPGRLTRFLYAYAYN